MASLVRQELSPRSFLHRQIVKAVNCGTVEPEDIITGSLSKRLKDGYDKGESGFILDGIPRSLYQAKIVDQLAMIDLVVNFRCFDFPSIKNHMDSEGAWKKKLQIYAEQTKPLEDYYRKQNKLINIELDSAPRETWQKLLVALHLQHVLAAPNSEKNR
ncbi:probable adenylate kinase 7, mitochondrial [Momordica charantia]|uniref:adenylate kinase n=1 Tax=Momordica charantia TaxID=3673 RepID=A0A6J1C5N4_MOMCH|nr:probable adenylate kinase 7, mitochondrial [Momordica charantia]